MSDTKPTHYSQQDWAQALKERDADRIRLYEAALRWSETLSGEDEKALRMAARSCRHAEATLMLVARALDGD